MSVAKLLFVVVFACDFIVVWCNTTHTTQHKEHKAQTWHRQTARSHADECQTLAGQHTNMNNTSWQTTTNSKIKSRNTHKRVWTSKPKKHTHTNSTNTTYNIVDQVAEWLCARVGVWFDFWTSAKTRPRPNDAIFDHRSFRCCLHMYPYSWVVSECVPRANTNTTWKPHDSEKWKETDKPR